MDYSLLSAVVYPQVTAVRHKRGRVRMNSLLRRKVRELLRLQEYGRRDVSVWGDNVTELSASGILSIVMNVYAYRRQAAHGLTLRDSVTMNVQSGHNYRLAELFRPGANYITPISEEIKRQIKERDLPLIAEFNQIKPNQPYFLREDNLVIYFATYEYTPYYVGLPEFPIPFTMLRDLIDEKSPLYRFLPPA
ncbi:MAG: Anti-sigma-V factor RsiV [Firmicutes bacterium]|nr:Anti-sigma-V factor RsiV [Bacillota bacterium]